MTPHTIWVGTNGYTKSVGEWIRHTAKMIDQGCKTKKGYRWTTIVDIHSDTNIDKLHYFGIRIDDMLYICGGCTDFSGEGGHGRKIAEQYLQKLIPEITECNGDDLINHLLGYYD